MPSFGVGARRRDAEQPLRVRLVVAEEQRRLAVASGRATSSSWPRNGCSVTTRAAPPARSSGLSPSTSHAHVLRYQAVGSTCSVSASGPGVRDADRSSAGRAGRPSRSRPRRSSSGRRRTTPVSSSSYSGSSLPRRAFSATRSPYGNSRLRVVVAPAVPRVARQRVEVPPVLLGVLAVVALVAGEPEDPLLQDRVAAVPERERRGRAAARRRRSRRARPRPSGTRASARGRAAGTPTRCRPGCSPRAPCPTGAR